MTDHTRAEAGARQRLNLSTEGADPSLYCFPMSDSSFCQPFKDPNLAPVFEQVFAGRDLTEHHCHALLATTDIYGVQRLALEGVSGRDVSYRRSYTLTLSANNDDRISEDIGKLIERSSSVGNSPPGEHFTIDLHLPPDASVNALCQAIRRLRDGFGGASIRALTLSRFGELALRENISYASLAATLAGAGLSSLLPSFLADNSAAMLIPIRACTLGFGIISNVSPASRPAKARELVELRKLARRVGGISEFAPFCSPPEQPEHSGFAELKTIAAARLVLRDIERLTILWGSTTWKMVQMSFAFGVNHIDGLPLGSLDQFLANTGAPSPLGREVEHVIAQAHRQPRAV